jgi:hypothetical protein
MNRYLNAITIFLLFLYSGIGGRSRADESDGILRADSAQLKGMLLDAMGKLAKKSNETTGYGVYEIIHDHVIGTPKPKADVWEISVCGPDRIKVLRKEGEIELVEVVNESYAFVLTRSKAGSFSVAGVQKPGRSLDDDLTIRDKMNMARYYLLDAYSYYGRTVWGLVGDPGFEISKISCTKDDTAEIIVKVEFNYAPVGKLFEGVRNIEDWTLKGAYLVFLPDHDWTLKEYGRPGYPRTLVAVENHPSNQLAFTDNAVARIFSDGKIEKEDSIRCIKTSYDPIPKEHFYLSHYGFPEPNFDAVSRWPWILGTLVLAGCLLILSRKLLRR